MSYSARKKKLWVIAVNFWSQFWPLIKKGTYNFQMPTMLNLFLPTYRIFLNSAHKRAQYAKWNNVSHVWKDDFPLYLDFLFQSVSSWCLLCFSFVVLSCFQLCCIPLSELMKSHYPLKKKKRIFLNSII